MRGSITALVGLILLGACGSDPQGPEARVDEYAAALGTDGAGKQQASAGGASAIAEANDLWDFAYSYPATAGRVPDLRAMLDARRTEAFADLKDQAMEGRATADEQGFPFNPYSLHVEWKTVASLPKWLSLSSEFYSYTGGAHGNTGFDALVWDKQGNRSLEPIALFTSRDALQAAVKDAFCASLDRQREKRRGEPVDPTKDDWMNTCPGIDETTVILGSSNSRTFDRIGFLIGPYVAGPYAEGTFEVTLPVTAAVKATVKSEYADSFTVTG